MMDIPREYRDLAWDEMLELRMKKTWKIKDDSMAVLLLKNYIEHENYKAAHEVIELVRLKREKEKKQLEHDANE